jgi:hypothetical protein
MSQLVCYLAMVVPATPTTAAPNATAGPERYEIVERLIGSNDYHRLQNDIMGHVSDAVPGTVVFRRTVSVVPDEAVNGTAFGRTTWHTLGGGRMGLKRFGVTRFRDGSRYLDYRDDKAPYPRDVAIGVKFRMDGARESMIYPGPRGNPQTYLMLTVRSLP